MIYDIWVSIWLMGNQLEKKMKHEMETVVMLVQKYVLQFPKNLKLIASKLLTTACCFCNCLP